MRRTDFIVIISNGKKIVLKTDKILYVLMMRKIAEIHVSGHAIYETRMTLNELESKLGEHFVKIHRGCLVSVMAIHDITDKINLSNGEHLYYTKRKKKQIIEQVISKQKQMIHSFEKNQIPSERIEYEQYYRAFDYMPFAFTDIEMVFNDEVKAVDWIFRYANPMLAKIEKLSLDKLIGHSFGSIFANMDEKWLRTYERATLYGETLEMMDYSPEIDTYLKVICFPTFKGHCGCILFDISQIRLSQTIEDAQKALLLYLDDYVN